MGGIECMTSMTWKESLLKNKDICNQLVLSEKRSNPKFSSDDVSTHIIPFFDSITNKGQILLEEGTILTLYETFVTLLSKEFLQQLQDNTSHYYQILLDAPSHLKQNPVLFLTYLTNAISKLENEKKKLFLKRLESIIGSLQSIEELTIMIGLFYWASGKPEYRESLYTQFLILRAELKTELKKILGLNETSLQSPFAKSTPNHSEGTSIHFRIIPGSPLFGGSFLYKPVLYKNLDSILVCSGEKWFQLFIDEFGTSLYPTEFSKEVVPSATLQTYFWKEMIQKKFELNSIVSAIENDSYVILSLNHSYQLYLFYIGRS